MGRRVQLERGRRLCNWSAALPVACYVAGSSRPLAAPVIREGASPAALHRLTSGLGHKMERAAKVFHRSSRAAPHQRQQYHWPPPPAGLRCAPPLAKYAAPIWPADRSALGAVRWAPPMLCLSRFSAPEMRRPKETRSGEGRHSETICGPRQAEDELGERNKCAT